MKNGRPFIEDGSGYGLSRTEFRRKRRAEKRELMIQWFNENFEDPAERMPYESREGGYQWIWGGPYNARDELESKFGGLAPDALIEEAIQEIERHGIVDWAPTPSPDDYDEYEPPDEPPSLTIFSDEPTEDYGSPEDHNARARVREALDRLQKELDRSRPIGIGHNKPPLDDEQNAAIDLRAPLAELAEEFAKPNPAIQLVKRWSEPLRAAIVAAAKWVGRKLDKAVDAAMAAGGAAAAGCIGVHYSHELQEAFNAIVHWLEIVARPIF